VTISKESLDAFKSAQRILVLGPCGSGKTCLTRQLSCILKLPAVHLDAHFWNPGWISTPQPQWRRVVDSLIKQPSWIMDGTYESTLDLRIPAADAIIMLSRPRWYCLWGVLRRSLIYRNKPRPDAPSDQPIDRAYLRYIWKYPVQTDMQVRALIKQHGPWIPVVELDRRESVEVFMSYLQAAPGRASAGQKIR
jgi:adenylate kinase family enzyme